MITKSVDYWTYEKCKESASTCKNITQFKKQYRTAYYYSRINKWTRDFFTNYPKPNGYWNNFENCKEVAFTCKNISEFQQRYVKAYYYSRINKWTYIFFPKSKLTKPNGYWTFEKCKELSSTCKNIREFSSKSTTAYRNSKDNNWLIIFFPEKPTKWTYEYCKELALSCGYKTEFVKKYPTAYITSVNMGWINEFVSHMKNPSIKWTYERCKAESKKFKTRGLFGKYSRTAYNVSLSKGWINEFYINEIKQSFSIPQLISFKIISTILKDNDLMYNTRKIIKPYELDIYSPKFRLGFEYNGKKWHINNNNDIKKKNRCISEDILLITIIENSRYYIDDIKNQLISNLPLINNYTNLHVIENDIRNIDDVMLMNYVSENVLDIKAIKQIISKYEYYDDFYKNEKSLFVKLISLNKLHFFTDSMKKRERINIKYTYEICKELSSKCTSKHQFKKNYPSAWIRAKKQGWLKELTKNMVRPTVHNKKWIYEVCRDKVKDCRNKSEFINKYRRAYDLSVKMKWIDEFFPKN